MPRQSLARKSKNEVVLPTNSLVASSTRYPGRAPRIYVPRADWQAECYRHYTICGEARFAARFFGHSCSRATLGVAELVRGAMVSMLDGADYDNLMELFSGPDGQTQMLDSIGTHLTIAGECFLVGRQTELGDTWEIVSVMEMQVAGDRWQINYGNGLPAVPLSDDDVVIRIWTPNPARRIEADSAFRALLPLLGEIEWLTRHVFSQITSRLAGAGILFLPQGITFPPPVEADGVGEPVNQASAFMQVLGDAMLTPIDDPGSPAAQVPIVATVPDDAVDKPKLLTFWSDLDSEAKVLREEAIQRFALGMDLPPEMVLGMSSNPGTGGGTSRGISHWGAWAIEESTIKLHIEPMLDSIVNALTMSYLRPAREGSTATVTYDTTRLKLRPDRSREAIELYDRGLVSSSTVLRETGFNADDTPEAEEFRNWLLRKMATGSTTPEQVAEAARQLGVDLGETTVPSALPRQERPPPSLEDHPTRPRTPAEAASLLLAASEPLVFRALERAGNRLRSSGSRPPNVPAFETHCYVKANGQAAKCLEDAWSCAPQSLTGHCTDPDRVIEVLNAYCLSLLNEGSPHSRERLSQWLALGGVV